MSTKPNPLHLKPGAAIVTAPSTPAGNPILVKLGDCVLHPSGAGFHICCVPLGATAVVPVGGLKLGESSDQFHWSTGASYSGQGVPATAQPTATFDQLPTLYGSDGRISGSGATGKPVF